MSLKKTMFSPISYQTYLVSFDNTIWWQLRVGNHTKQEIENNSILKSITIFGREDKNMKMTRVMSRWRHISLWRETASGESESLGQLCWWPSTREIGCKAISWERERPKRVFLAKVPGSFRYPQNQISRTEKCPNPSISTIKSIITEAQRK